MHSQSRSTTDLPTSELVRHVLLCEAEAIRGAVDQIAASIDPAVQALADCRGRVIVSGMGKMGCIARKASATFCSTGTPAIFLHPSEALHGDLGVVTADDVLIALSKSGETTELLQLLPFMHRMNVPIISITGSLDSELAERSSHVIDVSVKKEADQETPAPTCSSTVALATCDALAVALMRRRGFTKEQFASFHPGGILGRKLLLTVADVMHSGDELPVVEPDLSLRDAIMVMSQKRLGVAILIDAEQRLAGILTDGDLRRTLERNPNPLSDKVSQYKTSDPHTIHSDALAAEAICKMEDMKITVLPVVDQSGRLVGVVHLHDLLRAGLA